MQRKLYLPAVIILASLIIGIGLLVKKNAGDAKKDNDQIEKITFLEPVNSKDHFWGNPNASVYLIVFSDYDCVFCATLHKTMYRLMENYAKEGKVAWVFRHLPITEIHKEARGKALAAECSALGYGEDKFWKMSDELFRSASSTAEIVEKLGMDSTIIKNCVDGNEEIATLIDGQKENALLSGAIGSPYTIIVADGKAVASIDGAVSLSEIKELLDNILKY